LTETGTCPAIGKRFVEQFIESPFFLSQCSGYCVPDSRERSSGLLYGQRGQYGEIVLRFPDALGDGLVQPPARLFWVTLASGDRAPNLVVLERAVGV